MTLLNISGTWKGQWRFQRTLF